MKFIPTAERIQLVLSFALRVTIFLAMVSAAVQQKWLTFTLSAAMLFFTFLPGLFERNVHVSLPTELEIVVVLFLYASIFLGSVHSYYTRFWWWDVLLHTSSGIILGALGFILVYVLNGERSIPLKLSPGFLALFAFFFAVGAGAVWEIFEFSMDVFFNTTMQASLVDTMWDLIVDTAGALIAAFAGYFYALVGKRFVGSAVERFVKENPQYFT